MRRDWWVPLIGILFVIVTIVSFAVMGGEPPGAEDGPAKVVEHYVDNKDSIQVSAAIAALAAGLFVYYAAYLRTVLRRAEGGDGMLPSVVLAGAAVFATGVGIDASLSFALADKADEISPVAAQALQTYWDNDFFPLAIGIQLFVFAAGLSTVLHGGLPKWLGWFGILLGIIAVTPAGFIAFPGTGLWIVIASIVLTMRNRSAGAEGPPPRQGMQPGMP